VPGIQLVLDESDETVRLRALLRDGITEEDDPVSISERYSRDTANEQEEGRNHERGLKNSHRFFFTSGGKSVDAWHAVVSQPEYALFS
jgi:hypothetical protein